MKYALFVFILLYSFAIHAEAPLKNFSDSPALMTLMQFMADNSEDMQTSFRLSDKKLKLPDTSSCVPATKKEILKLVESSIQKVLRFFPDEEVPFEEAINDLDRYLGSSSYMKCEILRKNTHKIINSQYFYDSRDSKHVLVDTITLLDR